MKFWLACFLLLFVGAELFEWVAQIGSWHPSGVGLVLGGMGLAAASNAAHLPKLVKPAETAKGSAIASTSTEESAESKTKNNLEKPVSIAEPSVRDSISFEVRSPWR